jgi:hypothetical protein
MKLCRIFPPRITKGVRSLQLEPDFQAEGERELASLQADFPAFEIWREETGHGTLYIARSPTLGMHPHTVVTTDPAEIRSALSGSPAPPEPPRQGPSVSPPSPD